MKLYFISLAAGLLVGVIYHLLDVKSPAPPVAALIGLLGMLIGEQIIPLSKQYFFPKAPSVIHTQIHETPHNPSSTIEEQK